MQNSSHRFSNTVTFLFCVIPLIATIAPRGLAFAAPILGLITFMGYTLRDYKMPIPSTRIIFSLCAILALMGGSVLWGYDAEAITWEYVLKAAPLFFGIALLTGTFTHYRNEIVQNLAPFFPFACILGAVIVIINLYGDSAIYRAIHPEGITLKNLSHLNRSVVSITLMIVLSLYLSANTVHSAQTQKVQRVASFILCALLLAILVKTDSQSAQLAAMTAIAAAILIPYAYNKFWVIPATTTTLLLLSAPFMAQSMFAYIASSVKDTTWLKEGYASARMEIWDFVSRRAMEHPWIGHGIEATRSIKDFDIAHVYHIENGVLHPHNFAIQAWIEFGLLGAALFSLILTLCLRGIWRGASINGRRAQFTLFAMTLVMAAISYGLWQGWWIGLLGFIFAGAQLFYTDTDDRSASTKDVKSSGSAASY